MDTVERIRQVFNPNLSIEGVVLTMYDDRTNLAQAVTDELKNFFGDRLCTTTIPRNVKLAEAPSHGKPALVYDVRSRGAESYIRLAKELLDRNGIGVQDRGDSTDAEPAEVAAAGESAPAMPVEFAAEIVDSGAVDRDDEPLFAYFDPALIAAVADAAAEIPAELAVAGQFADEHGAD